jgi:hypothetical protein
MINMDILFDENGYIKSKEPLEMDWDSFEETFVFNDHRRDIFTQYIEFLEILRGMPVGNFYQWVNGSFTTMKPLPKDIDFVSFVDSVFYRRFEKRLQNLSKEFKFRSVDAYFEPVFPANHFMSAATRYNAADWQHLYGRDRQFRKKGFVKIKF